VAVKVIGYTRVSTREQGESGISLLHQADQIEEYCTRSGIELTHLFEDVSSGKKTHNREGLQEALRLCEPGCMFVVYKLDRLTRSIKDLNSLVELFAYEKYNLVCIQENLDASTATGRLIMNLLSSVIQWEREVISERTKDALHQKRKSGQVYGPVPYGYNRKASAKGDILEPDGYEQGWIGQMQIWRASGLSDRYIAKLLNDKKIPTKRGGKWYGSTVNRVLTRWEDLSGSSG
jgi:DNA invertase Pin-like site-specific DNA recombinase